MNGQLKNLIYHMQRGWNKLPRNPTDQSSFGGSPTYPTSACPLVHAYYGKTGEIAFYDAAETEFPILTTQKVWKNRAKIELSGAILYLADQYNWSTPQIIAWLKSHLKD